MKAPKSPTLHTEEIVNRLLDLQSLLCNMHEIQRLVYLPGGTKRRETDTEHSYSLAMTAWYACGHFPEFDKNKVIQYALAHDLVEIYAGDIMAIGRTDAQQAEKEEKELKAIARLKDEWPDFPEMTEAFETYEKQQDPEAVFVKALDKIMAPMMNIKTDGAFWKEHGISKKDVIENKDEKTKDSEEVSQLWNVLRQYLHEHDELFGQENQPSE